MLVRELIDFLRVQDPDAVVEVAIVESDPNDDTSIDLTRLPLLEMITLPDDENDDQELVWLVVGEADDVDDFIDAIADDDFDED